mgnify:CR=1 FL=1
MNEQLKKILRDILMEYNGVDIDHVECHFSTPISCQNLPS